MGGRGNAEVKVKDKKTKSRNLYCIIVVMQYKK
jgi:hypothetical protein